MSVKKKIIYVQLMSIALFLLLAVVVNIRFQQMQPELAEMQKHFDRLSGQEMALVIAVKDARYNATQVQQWLTDISATRGLDGLNDGFDEAKAAAERFLQNVEDAKQAAGHLGLDDVINTLNQMEKDFPAYYETGQRMARAYVAYGPEGGNAMMGEFDATAAKIGDESERLVLQVEELVKRDAGEITDKANVIRATLGQASYTVLAISIAALLGTLFAAVYLYRLMSRNFNALTRDVNAIEHGRYDDVPALDVGNKDEFGAVARALESVRVKLRRVSQLEAEQQESERRLRAEQVAARNELASRFQQRVQGIIESVAAAATQLYQTSESMSGIIGDVGAKASSVASNSGETSRNVQMVASAAEEMSASVREIAQQITKSSSAVKMAVVEVEKADGTAAMLEQATTRIGEVVGLIQGIAGQINLLSLNATIESARAGEAGKGFAVVASEVKHLAGQTATATGEISETISSIQDVSRQVLGALTSIKEAIAQVDEFSSAISAAVEEQTATTNEISVNMSSAAQGTTRINQDISMVNEATGEAGLSAQQVLDAAKMLSKEAESLAMEVDMFLSEVREG